MAKYKVKANPKAGTAFQTVEANSEGEAIAIAKANPNDWKNPEIKSDADWTFRAYKQ